MQKLGGNSKTPLAVIAFIVRLSEFLRELYYAMEGGEPNGVDD